MPEPLLPGVKPDRLRRLLRRLVDIYSPTGKEEEILDYLYSYLRRHGLPVVRQPVDDHRYNLVVAPPETDIRLALIGHVDTVAAYDLEDYGFGQDGDRVTGLGTADMKGGCAAMVEAYRSVWEAGYSRIPAALALVVGEEWDGDGAQRLVKEFHFPWAIVGEPTDLVPCLGHFGYLEVGISTSGKRMHASLADRGANPIQAMLHLLLTVLEYLEGRRPDVIYNIRELTSAQAGFAVPERCDTWLDLHLPPTAPVGDIMLELEEVILRRQEEDTVSGATLRFTTVHSGYQLPEKGFLVQVLRDVFSRHSLLWAPQVFRSHSDANLIWAAGVKPIILGCGRLEEAHTPDESVSFGQVCRAASIYFDVLRSLCLDHETFG